MTDTDTVRPRGGRMHMRRSRGAVTGLLLLLLGLWGALIPYVGPDVDFAFTPDEPWTWTVGRGWLQVLPGAVVALGGLMLMVSRSRATAMLGGWLAVAGGTWFVVGRAFAGLLGLGDAGAPVASNETERLWLEMTHFYGLGALIILLGGMAVGRVSIRSVRDIEYATTPATTATAAGSATPAAAPVTTPAPADTTVPAETTGSGTGPTATTARAAASDEPVAAAPKRRRWTNPFSRRHTTAH